MPLHLLGKKSWNVYNPENIARVNRDEAAAKAKTELEEREKRDDGASNRLKILRGESLHEDDGDASGPARGSRMRLEASERPSKRRRLAGENDTDRDIRQALADTKPSAYKSYDEAITDSNGHINLVPQHAERQKANKEQQDDTAGGMRFKDAAGYNADGNPWYAGKAVADSSRPEISRDVWGNEDPRRRERDQQRMSANDPLLAMKKGVKKLRENEKQRKDWIAQREKDLYEVERLAKIARRRRRDADSDQDSLEGFSLDKPGDGRHSHRQRDGHRQPHHGADRRSSSPRQKHRHRHHHRRTHRSRDD